MSKKRSYDNLKNRIGMLERTLTEHKKWFSTYHTLFHEASDAIFIHDIKDGRIKEANQKALEMFCFSRDEILQMDILSLSKGIPPYSQAEIKLKLDQVTDGEPMLFEWRCKKKDGNLFWVELNMKKIFFEDEVMAIAVLRDISHRKKTENEFKRLEQLSNAILKKHEDILRTNQLKYKTILQTAGDGFMLVDTQGRILEVNDAYCRMSGYSEKELLSMTIHGLEGRMKPDEITSIIDRMKTDRYDRFETRHQRKDGSQYDVEISVTYINDENGRLVNFIRDISLFKASEKEKTDLQDQLNQIQKLKSIGRLAGGVAHDLNNLLTPVIGYTEMLMDNKKGTTSRQEKLQSIYDAGVKAKKLVGQLLAFSRKQTLEFRLLDLDKIILDFKMLLRRTIREDIHIDIITAPGAKTVMADQTQLEQILMNLSVNGADAMQDGGVLTIETTITQLDEAYAAKRPGVVPGHYILMRFSDTGHGMDKETCGKIFEPFYSTKGKQGTGLGLATVYGIVKQHRGNIWVYSEVGKGTVFEVYLPYVPGKEAEITKKHETIADLTGCETILLAEDNKGVRDLATDILAQNGYTVFPAENGNDALEIWASIEEPVDLLVTDVIMPEMNGKELYESLHSLEQGIRVLYLSGYPDNVIARHGILDHGVQYIQKPFRSDDFLLKVRDVLDSED